MQSSSYPLGKVPFEHLARLLQSYHSADSRLILAGKIGEDAAVIDMGDRYLVAKTDPITFATEEIGWYAVTVNANDIACTGAVPRWFLATILLPERQSTPDLVDEIFVQIVAACESLNVALAGGHTEVTHGLDRPIVVGQMLGEVAKDKLILTSGARPGDDIVLTKRLAIEATAIIAGERREELQDRYSNQELDRLANYIYQPGISIVPEAKIAVEVGGVHAMHDPTEGGIATGLWELSYAAGVGLEIFLDNLPYDPDSLALCQYFGLNPLGVIASGSLLLTVDPDSTPSLRERLKRTHIDSAVIGQVRPADFGVKLIDARGSRPLPTFERDEIAKIFE